MQLLEITSLDPTFNLALEECLLEEPGESFLLWRNDRSIIVGRHQNTAAEIDAAFVRAADIRVVRRITGGGAVYHDAGNVNFSFILEEERWKEDSGIRHTAPLIRILRELGVEAAWGGRNDILANGAKISGCARSVRHGKTLFHGTLLFSADLSVLAQALNPDPEKIKSKGIASIRARVANLSEWMPRTMDVEMFLDALRTGMAAHFGEEFHAPSPTLSARAESLANEKYRTWDWNYGSTLRYTFENTRRFAGGRVGIGMNIEGNKIREIRFSGDFFGSRPLEELANRLCGLAPRREILLAHLRELELGDYLSGVTPEELAGLMAPV